MRKMEQLAEIQQVELDIMKKTVAFLEANGLTYILAGGSMLGAVRHNGFIPWDDDIDILVPRKDFEKIKALVRAGQSLEDGYAIKLPGDQGYCYPFIKAVNTRTIVKDENIHEQFELAVWVDIFPLDHFPDSELGHKLVLMFNKFLRTALNAKIKRNGLTKGNKAIRVFFELLNKLLGGVEGTVVKIDAFARWCDKTFAKSNHYADGSWPENMRDYFEEEMVMPVIKHAFEDTEFNIPAGYDLYLTRFYGDYMTPPPENKRARHFIQAYHLD